MKNPINFDAKIGWSELIAVVALSISIYTYITNNTLKEYIKKKPKYIIENAHMIHNTTFKNESLYVAVKNIGEFPITGVQFIFDSYYLHKSNIRTEDIDFDIEPKYPYDINIKNNYIYIRINTDLPPGKGVNINIIGRPIGITVTADSGDLTYIPSSACSKI